MVLVEQRKVPSFALRRLVRAEKKVLTVKGWRPSYRVEQGKETSHFDQIELSAHALEQRLSRMIQSERACEVAVAEKILTTCPNCSRRCRVEVHRRTVNSIDGPIDGRRNHRQVPSPPLKTCNS
jgi:uncharacterized Fe-S radical SAM superfamily protein PflX